MFVQWGKRMIRRTGILFCAVFFSSVLFASHAYAATLFVSPGGGDHAFGADFTAELRIDSAGQSFNAAEATVEFPTDILQVKSLDYSGASSAFSFWLETPAFSNTAGTIHFIGGTTAGITGSSIRVLKITFTTKGLGSATVSITGAAITAADGSGTNILSAVQPARFTVSATTLAPLPTPPAVTSTVPLAVPAPIVIIATSTAPAAIPISLGPPPAPVQITRKPVAAKNSPAAPTIVVGVYPKPDGWYNVKTNYLVTWQLPADISGVATAVNTNKTFDPTTSEGLFDAKTFPALSDGIWYLHIRFKNNVGWGPTTHYRIAMDTVPPTPLVITSSQGLQSDFPQPTLTFNTKDGLSGIAQYFIQVDDGGVITQTTNTIVLPLLAPGKHTILVKAADVAGNMTQQSIDLEILPIASPVISNIQKTLFVGEGGLTVSGNALPNIDVVLTVKNASGVSVDEKTAHVDSNGNWNALFDSSFKKGTYVVLATAKDSRGALSLPVASSKISVREKPLLTIGGLEITLAWVYVISILAFLTAAFFAIRTYRRWRERTERNVIIAQRDVANVFGSVNADIDKVLQNAMDKKLDPQKIAEMQFVLKKMKKNLERVEGYVEENIKDISK